MIANFLSLVFSVFLTLFALAPWYVDQSLRFLMAKEIDGVMIVLTILAMVSIGLLVQDLGSRSLLSRWSGFIAFLVAGVWTLGVCITFWTTVEPLWQRTVPGIIFALASIWLPFLAWMPFWNLSLTNRVVIILALLFLQPFFVLRYKIQPLNPQGEFVVVKRSDLYRRMMAANSSPPPPQSPAPTPSMPAEKPKPNVPAPSTLPRAIEQKPAPDDLLPAGWEFFAARPGLGSIKGDSPNVVSIQINPGNGIKPWDVEWTKAGISLTKDLPLEVSFRAKATQAGSVYVRFQENHAPWRSLGIDQKVELSSDWKDFKFTGAASDADSNARVAFQLGGASGQISIADLQFTPGDSGFVKKTTPAPVTPPAPPIAVQPTKDLPPAEPQSPPSPVGPRPIDTRSPLEGWTLSTDKGSASMLTILPGPPPFLRVTVPSSNPKEDWKVMLVREDISLEKGKSYIAKVRGRANLPRSVSIVTTLSTPPWKGTGLFAPIELTTEWKESVIEFTANESGPCRFYVALAGAEAVMEFSSIELTPKP